MRDEYIVKKIGRPIKPKGIFKGEDDVKDSGVERTPAFEQLVLDMKRLLDDDLQKA